MEVPSDVVGAVIALQRNEHSKPNFDILWAYFRGLDAKEVKAILNPLAAPDERHTQAASRAFFHREVIDLPNRCLKQVDQSAKQE